MKATGTNEPESGPHDEAPRTGSDPGGSNSVLPQNTGNFHRRRSALLGWLLFGLVLWTFYPAVRNDFVGYDDPGYVTANGRVQQGLSWSNVQWAFRSSELANWHPLTWLSHMLDCELFGLAPRGHHLVNVLLHAVNAVLAFVVLRQMTGAMWRSLLVATLFAVHPLRVESVAWIAERKDVLCACFGLLTLRYYARHAQQRSRVEGRESSAPTLDYFLALLCFVLGLMCKPMLVTLPCILLLLDYWPLQRGATWRKLMVEKLPFFLAAIAVSAVTLAIQNRSGAVLAGLPASVRMENAAVSYCRYLGKLFVPVNLAAFYPYPRHWPTAVVLLTVLLLLLISWCAVNSRRRYPYLLVGWLWFLGTLVPVIGFVQTGAQSMADRYSYIPSLGVFLMGVWLLHELSKGWPYPGIALSAIVLAVAVGYITLTRLQIGYWRDTETLFRHALRVTKENYLAHNNLGTALDQHGRPAEAISEFQEAIKEKPDYPEALVNLGLVLDRQGRSAEAIGRFQEALSHDPTCARAHDAWGTILNREGHVEEAISHYREAVRLNPDFCDAHYNLGLALGRTGHLDEALPEFLKAIRLKPDLVDAYNNLGVALAQKGQTDEAIQLYRVAVQLKPDFPAAHFNLGLALCSEGNFDEGIAEFQEALRLKPDYAEAQQKLETALRLRKTSEEPAVPTPP